MFPNNLVFVSSHEFGSKIQIMEVKKIKRNLSFSIKIILFLRVLYEKTLEDRTIIRIIGKLWKFNLTLGRNKMKNWGLGKII